MPGAHSACALSCRRALRSGLEARGAALTTAAAPERLLLRGCSWAAHATPTTAELPAEGAGHMQGSIYGCSPPNLPGMRVFGSSGFIYEFCTTGTCSTNAAVLVHFLTSSCFVLRRTSTEILSSTFLEGRSAPSCFVLRAPEFSVVHFLRDVRICPVPPVLYYENRAGIFWENKAN